MYRQYCGYEVLNMKQKQYLSRIYRKLRSDGVMGTVRAIKDRLIRQDAPNFPLAFANKNLMFACDTETVRNEEKQQMRATSMVFDASNVEKTYPHVFEYHDRIMRYAYLPAEQKSKGLVVLFHGHNAYLHMGPMIAWDHFDILAPWDTFGWNRMGSWFWGEKGNNFIEDIVWVLIEKHRAEKPNHPWFCMGGSMGGFAALYHGIKRQCDGMYVTVPQVDLRLKVKDYGENNTNNPYVYLKGDTLESVPDLIGLAAQQEFLPPLFLIQHQYDPVNNFADHAFRLLQVYNEKRAWYGIRVYPAIGHSSDGSQPEAEAFFNMIVEKAPPKRFEASQAQTSKTT